MTCDAERMRKMMDEHNTHKAFYSVDDVLTETVSFSENPVKEKGTHYFKVEMLDIPDLYDELYTLTEIKEYLSFVAPVSYDIPWRFKKQIHLHAQNLGQPIQEYHVKVDGEPVLKKYKPSFTTSKGEDTITEIDFKDFYDPEGKLSAWLWFGISRFQGVLKQENAMRGIRLRMQNIQIGSDDALQKLFKEDRGQHYFVGEVFAITRDLIPNSQRDYFNPGEARIQFEQLLSAFFNEDLSRIYKAGSTINSRFDKIQKVEKIQAEIDSSAVVTDEQQGKLERAQREAAVAAQELAKLRQKTSSSLEGDNFGTYEVVVSEIFKRNEAERASRPPSPIKSAELPSLPKSQSKMPPHAAPTLPQKDSAPQGNIERLIPLSKIKRIVRELTDSSIADKILAKIEEELE